MRKMILLILMLTSLLTFGGATLAQEIPPVFCGNLAEADCALLKDSVAAMTTLESAAFNFQLDFAMNGIPSFPGELDFTLSGDGAYALEAGMMSELMALYTSPAEIMENLDELPELLETVLKAISVDVNLTLFIPTWAQQMAAQSNTELPEKVGLSLRLVDGFGYVNLDKLAELDTTGSMPRGWLGLDLATFYRRMLEQSMDMMGSMMSVNPLNPAMMDAFTSQEFMARYMSIERLADTQADGQNAAVFQIAFDLGALYSSPEFKDLMTQQMEAMGGTGLSSAEVEQMMSMMTSMFDGFTVQMTQTIGLDDQYVHQMSMTLDWPIDLNAMMGQMGAGSSASQPPINLAMAFEASLSQFNRAPAITAPQDAQITPVDDLLPK